MNENFKKNQLLSRELHEEIEKLSEKELYYIKHTLNTIKTSREDSIHFIGSFLGINVMEYGAKMILGPHNSNTYGVAQGGALYTLADMAIGFHVLPKLKKNQEVYTLELKINFIRKGQGDQLFAKVEILHWGRSTVVANCSIFDEENKLVAQGLGTFYIK